MLRTAIIPIILVTLSGCVTAPNYAPIESKTPDPLNTLYDYQVYGQNGEIGTTTQLAQQLAHYDIILVGEYHSHPGIHRLQTDLFYQMVQVAPVQLSMEQFSRDKQAIVSNYIKGEIGEALFLEQANAWPNYKSDYRGIVEIAKAYNRDVIAANAPRNMVKCIGRHGDRYIESLSLSDRALLASEINTQSRPYKTQFMQLMGLASGENPSPRYEQLYQAQITWDATMAESMLQASYVDTPIYHIAGNYHVDQAGALDHALLARDSRLKIAKVVPFFSEKPPIPASSRLDSYFVRVQPLPLEHLNEDERKLAYKRGHSAGAKEPVICFVKE
ncbi:ChaN family lipoprotein [Vibrio agarilyticus]|nr:ChaN family lipoprotein [Vibrio agarilyticus]